MPGFNSASSETSVSVMYADNASFDGTQRDGILNSNGKVWMGASSGQQVRIGEIVGDGTSVNVTYSETGLTTARLTISLVGGGDQAVDTFLTDINSPAKPNSNGEIEIGFGQVFSSGFVDNRVTLNVEATENTFLYGQGDNVAMAELGPLENGQLIIGQTGSAPVIGSIITDNTTVSFALSGTDIKQDFGINNLLLGSSGTNFTTADENTSIGNNALDSLTSGLRNVGIGISAGDSITTGSENTIVGSYALNGIIGGGQNTALGNRAFNALTAGSDNIGIGDRAGASLTSGSANIYIGADQVGAASESNTIRIGTSGVHTSSTYIYGIDGVNVGDVATVVTESGNKLGTANIISGKGISVVPTANTITINSIGGGFTWVDVTGTSDDIEASTGYVANNAGLVTLTLPATCSFGDIHYIVGKGSGGWLIAQNAGQTIHFGNQDTTTGVGGSLASTNQYDVVLLLCVTDDTDWIVLSSVGNITVT